MQGGGGGGMGGMGGMGMGMGAMGAMGGAVGMGMGGGFGYGGARRGGAAAMQGGGGGGMGQRGMKRGRDGARAPPPLPIDFAPSTFSLDSALLPPSVSVHAAILSHYIFNPSIMPK